MVKKSSVYLFLFILILSNLADLWAQPVTNPQSAQDIKFYNRAVEAYNKGRYVESSLIFFDIISNGVTTEIIEKCQYYLAKSLLKLGLLQPAMYYFSVVFKTGPIHPYYLKAIENLVNIAEKKEDDIIIPSLFTKYYSQDFGRLKPDVLYRANYIVGYLLYNQGKLQEASAFLNTVSPKSKVYPKALYILGIIDYRHQNYKAALEKFKKIISLPQTTDKIRNLTKMALGRTYYGLRNYEQAIKYYKSIPRFLPYWQASFFELGWAHYKNKQYGYALGDLHSVTAPSFEDKFIPETWVLMATIYFRLCLYPAVNNALDSYDREYVPYMKALEQILSRSTDVEYYYRLMWENRPPEQGGIPEVIKKHMLLNPRLRKILHFLKDLEKEEKKIKSLQMWQGSTLESELLGQVNEQKRQYVKIAGQWIMMRLRNIYQTLQDFKNQIDLIRYETTKAAEEMLERGKDPDVLARMQKTKKPDNIPYYVEYWHFNGEYWLDELGYYVYTVEGICGK